MEVPWAHPHMRNDIKHHEPTDDPVKAIRTEPVVAGEVKNLDDPKYSDVE